MTRFNSTNYSTLFFLLFLLFTLSESSFANSNTLNSANEQECFTLSFSVTRKSAETIFMNDDISPQKRGQYALYEIENTSSSISDVYVKADNFAGDIQLGDNEDEIFYIGNLLPGGKGYAYIYLVTDVSISGQNGFHSTSSTHDINVYDGNPEDGGTLIKTESFSITLIEDVIKANANKVDNVTINGTPTLGGTFTMTVTGSTGTIGAAKIFNFSAATNIDWVADAYELINTEVSFTKIGNGNNSNDGLVFTNNLYFTLSSTKNTEYEIVFTFLVDASSAGTSGFEPTTYVSSGQQIKHSVLSSGVSVPDLPGIAGPTSTLSGFVWSDDDFDGIKQSGESKMNGVKVRLLDTFENLLQSTTSSGTTGDFEFTNIEAGNYKIRFDRNDRFVPTIQDATTDDTLDSDINRATRIVDILVEEGVNISNITAGFSPDFDRDLIPDIVENASGTAYDAVDPAGYLYDELTGEIIPGGYIQVTGLGRIDIVDTGNVDGYYSWLIDGTPGVYTMTITPPPGYELSSSYSPLPTLDPTGLTPDPYSVGSPDTDRNGYLDDFSQGANPYYVTFELASGDPFVINNNIPLKNISLPVELSSFRGTSEDCKTVLQWTTQSEESFDYYEILWSDDGVDFKSMDFIHGLGRNFSQSYEWTHDAKPGYNYYKLKMVDLDDSFEFSNIIQVKSNCKKGNKIKVYPNPLTSNNNYINIDFYPVSSISQFIISDFYGRIIKRITIKTEMETMKTIQVDISSLSNGTYNIYQIGNTNGHLFIINDFKY